MLCMRGHLLDAFTCIIEICCLFKKFTVCICNNMTKTIVFTLQEHDITAKEAGGNVKCAA